MTIIAKISCFNFNFKLIYDLLNLLLLLYQSEKMK